MAVSVSQFTAMARAEFAKGKAAAEQRVLPAQFDLFTTPFPSKTKVETHTFMSALPRLYEFKGYSPSVRLTNYDYTVSNKEWRVGPVSVKQTDLDDDQVGGYLLSVKGIPDVAKRDTGFKVLSHLAAGTATACFDGTNLFANSHTVGSGDNLDTYNAASNDGLTHKIIALRTDNPFVKPVIYQDRQSVSGLETDADTPAARKVKEFEYWTDCRFGLGYGYWWDTYHVTITDTPTVAECYTIIEQIINGMRTFTLPKGRDSDDLLYVHEGWEPTPESFVLVCNLKLGLVLQRAMKITQYVASTGNVDNVYQNCATIIPSSALGA